MHKDKFKEFDRNCTRLDHFYFHNGIGIEKYSHLAHIVQILLTLSHGQASVERGFSQRNLLIQQNQNTDTMCAHRIIKDHMSSNGLQPDSIEISTQMLLAVKSARIAYGNKMEEQRRNKEISAKDAEIQHLISDITDVTMKKEALQKTVNALDEEFEKCVFQAEKDPTNCMIHISKSTALKRKSNEKREEIKKLEECLEVMEKTRKCGS